MEVWRDETFPKHGWLLLWNNLVLSLKWHCLVYKLWLGFLMQKDVRSLSVWCRAAFAPYGQASPIQTINTFPVSKPSFHWKHFVLFFHSFQIKQSTEQKSSFLYVLTGNMEIGAVIYWHLWHRDIQYESWVFTVLTSLKVADITRVQCSLNSPNQAFL